MVREYSEADEPVVRKLLVSLQRFLIGRDNDKFLKEFDDGGKEYMQHLLWSVKDQEGKIFVYEHGGVVCGFVAGYLEKIDKMDELMSIIRKPGYVAELFIEESSRGKGYGRALMDEIEEYFKEQGCDVLTVTVDAFNHDARKMYEATGFQEHDILMLKKL